MKSLRLVRHVMRVDMLAQRWMLVAWGVILLGQAAVFAAGPERIAPHQVQSNYDFGVQVVRLGWTIIMAALFVQSDPLVGTTAFWMTRPIPRKVILTAKLVCLTCWFVVVPIVVMSVALLGLGMRPTDALVGGGLIGLEQGVVLVMAVMAALVTANIGQFVVAGIAGVTLVSVFNGLLLPVLTLAWPAVGDTLRGGQSTLYAAVVIVGGLAVSAHHYFTLRIWRTAALIASTMFLATGLARLWPAQEAERAPGALPESVLSAAAVSFGASSYPPRVEEFIRLQPGKRELVKSLEIATTTVGQPPEIYFWPLAARTKIRSAKLPFIERSGPARLIPVDRRTLPPTLPTGQSSAGREDVQPWRSIRLALGDVHMDAALRPWVYFTPVATLSETEFKAIASSPARLESDVAMVAYRYAVVASAPLKPGVGFKSTGRAGRIVSVTGVNSYLEVELRETFLDGQQPLAQGDFGSRWYVLRNVTKRQAVLLEWKGMNRCAATIGIAATRIVTTRGTLGLETSLFHTHHIEMDAEWLAGAELVVLEPQPLGVLTRTLVVGGVVLGREKQEVGGAVR